MKLAVALLLFLSFAAPARADEADAADLLRQARTAETVDRDVAKATDLYTKAITAAGDSKVGLDAWLALARLHEQRDLREEALQAFLTVARRYPSLLDDATRREVQAATIRLLPLGPGARAPVAAEAPASPLERKVEELFQASTNAEVLIGKLHPLGKDVLPILEGILFEANPDRAEAAAIAYARIGRTDALPGLARALREGDAFTRAAAAKAVHAEFRGEEKPRKDEASAIVAHLDPLLADAAMRAKLGWVVAGNLPEEELLARARKDPAHAEPWLHAALYRRLPGAEEIALEAAKDPGEPGLEWTRTLLVQGRPAVVPLALERIRRGGPEAADLLAALVKQTAWTGGAAQVGAAELPPATQLEFVDLLLAQPEQRWPDVTVRLLAGARGVPGAVDRVAATWKLLPSASNGRGFAQSLWAAELAPPEALFEDRDWARAYFKVRSGLNVPRGEPYASEAFWSHLLDVLPDLDAGTRTGLHWVLERDLARHAGPEAMPPASARWVDVVELPWHSTPQPPGLPFRAAAASGDPRYLEHVRKAAREAVGPSGATTVLGLTAARALEHYTGPGLLEFLREMLAIPALKSDYQDAFFRLLATKAGDEGRQEVLRIAREPSHPQAARAFRSANAEQPMDGLEKVYRRAADAKDLPPEDYRTALIEVAQYHRYRPAIPYLLREYRGGSRAWMAEKALDAIRTYHEKIEAFERWASEGSRPWTPSVPAPVPPATPGVAPGPSVASLLQHLDPDVRRAAAVVLGALGDRSAHPLLLHVAATDSDERVRKAALESLEKLRE